MGALGRPPCCRQSLLSTQSSQTDYQSYIIYILCNQAHTRALVGYRSTTIVTGLPDGDDLSGPDHRIIPGSLLDQFGTAYEKDLTHNQTDDINRR